MQMIRQQVPLFIARVAAARARPGTSISLLTADVMMCSQKSSSYLEWDVARRMGTFS